MGLTLQEVAALSAAIVLQAPYQKQGPLAALGVTQENMHLPSLHSANPARKAQRREQMLESVLSAVQELTPNLRARLNARYAIWGLILAYRGTRSAPAALPVPTAI